MQFLLRAAGLCIRKTDVDAIIRVPSGSAPTLPVSANTAQNRGRLPTWGLLSLENSNPQFRNWGGRVLPGEQKYPSWKWGRGGGVVSHRSFSTPRFNSPAVNPPLPSSMCEAARVPAEFLPQLAACMFHQHNARHATKQHGESAAI